MTHLIGAHLSAAGGYHNAITSIIEKGGNCLQIFSSSPRSWADATPTDDAIKQFNDVAKDHQIAPIFFHARYLINLANRDEGGKKSVATLIHELNLAKKMNVYGSIIHTGSFKTGKDSLKDFSSIRTTDQYKGLISNIKTVLSETPKETLMILENAGNRKIGETIEQLADIIEDVGDDRVRVCLDTCHLHAAGYDLRSDEHFDQFIEQFEQLIGLKKLELIHMNDSKDSFGSLRDRHENLGEGFVGPEVFKNFVNHPKTKHLPFIIETPGFDGKGPDKANLDILKGYIQF